MQNNHSLLLHPSTKCAVHSVFQRCLGQNKAHNFLKSSRAEVGKKSALRSRWPLRMMKEIVAGGSGVHSGKLIHSAKLVQL